MIRVFIILLLHVIPAAAETLYNAKGQEVGRASTNDTGTTYYNAKGQEVGRSTTNSSGTTTFTNANGQQTGSSRGGGRGR